jgi:hypothetical protein
VKLRLIPCRLDRVFNNTDEPVQIKEQPSAPHQHLGGIFRRRPRNAAVEQLHQLGHRQLSTPKDDRNPEAFRNRVDRRPPGSAAAIATGNAQGKAGLANLPFLRMSAPFAEFAPLNAVLAEEARSDGETIDKFRCSLLADRTHQPTPKAGALGTHAMRITGRAHASCLRAATLFELTDDLLAQSGTAIRFLLPTAASLFR